MRTDNFEVIWREDGDHVPSPQQILRSANSLYQKATKNSRRDKSLGLRTVINIYNECEISTGSYSDGISPDSDSFDVLRVSNTDEDQRVIYALVFGLQKWPLSKETDSLMIVSESIGTDGSDDNGYMSIIYTITPEGIRARFDRIGNRTIPSDIFAAIESSEYTSDEDFQDRSLDSVLPLIQDLASMSQPELADVISRILIEIDNLISANH